jgi:hypothetical protein
MAALSFVGHKLARDLALSRQFPYPPFELRALHYFSLGQFCPRVNQGSQRPHRDGAFHKPLLTKALNAHLGGDEAMGKAVLRDVINATVGFAQLAADLQNPGKSLRRMLSPAGNASTANFYAILVSGVRSR